MLKYSILQHFFYTFEVKNAYMKFTSTVFISLFACAMILAQNNLYSYIITKNSDTLQVSDITELDGKVSFFNVKTQTQEFLYFKSIQVISKEVFVQTKKPTNDSVSTQKSIEYPDGIYHSLADFKAKKPTSTEKIYAKIGPLISRKTTDSIESVCTFFHSNNKKVKDVFAVVYNQELYFRFGSIHQYRDEEYGKFSNSFPNEFIKVQHIGKQYLYLPLVYENSQVSGAYSGIGISITVPIGKQRTLEIPIIWNQQKNVFYILNRCKDIHKWISDYDCSLLNSKVELDKKLLPLLN